MLQRLGTATHRAEDVITISEEAAANQGRVTFVAQEAVTMPVTFLKRDELRASQTWKNTEIFMDNGDVGTIIH